MNARWIMAVVVLAGCGPIVEPQPTDLPPLTIDAVIPPPPSTISEPVTVSRLASRPMNFMQITPTLPPPQTPDGPESAQCPQWWSEARDVGWLESDLARLDAIMFRESRCQPGVHNRAGANGLMQIMAMWADDCGVTIAQLRQAIPNLACALHILHVQGWRAWAIG